VVSRGWHGLSRTAQWLRSRPRHAPLGDAARPNIYNQTADSEITILRSLLHAGSAPERSRL